MEIKGVLRAARGLSSRQLQTLEEWAAARREQIELEREAENELGLLVDVVERVVIGERRFWKDRWRCHVPGCWCRGGGWHRGGWWLSWQDERGWHLQCFGAKTPGEVKEFKKRPI